MVVAAVFLACCTILVTLERATAGLAPNYDWKLTLAIPGPDPRTSTRCRNFYESMLPGPDASELGMTVMEDLVLKRRLNRTALLFNPYGRVLVATPALVPHHESLAAPNWPSDYAIYVEVPKAGSTTI